MVKNIKRERVEKWIRKYGPYLTKVQIEKELDFTKEALTRFIRNERKLTNAEIEDLDHFIKKMMDAYDDHNDL